MGSTSGSVRASQRDSRISCAAMVSRSGARPRGHARAAAMPRAAADVDAHDRPPRVGRAGAAHDEHDVGRIGVDVGGHASGRQRLDERVLDDAAELERRRLEVGRGTDLDRKAEVAASGEPVVRRERRQEVVEERLEAHRGARAEIPRDSRRRAVMARRDPRDARVEGIEQRRFPLPLRLFDAHVERRAHHETLELRLHDAVGAAGTRQAQLVAALRGHFNVQLQPRHECPQELPAVALAKVGPPALERATAGKPADAPRTKNSR